MSRHDEGVNAPTVDRAALLAEAEQLERERTPGEWTWTPTEKEQHGTKSVDVVPANVVGPFVVDTDCGYLGLNDANAAFIAFCGTHMGTLLALLKADAERVQALEAEVERLKGEVKRLRNANGDLWMWVVDEYKSQFAHSGTLDRVRDTLKRLKIELD